jgi:hypothetical protein
MPSQAEEDRILELLTVALLSPARPLAPPTFVEIGVGPGYENNTYALAERGWRGVWVGNEPLAITPPAGVTFHYAQVEPDMVATLPLPHTCDVFSLDIDGNDYWVAAAILPRFDPLPGIVVVEYNSAWDARDEVMPYAKGYVWHQGQPFGASLIAWQRLLRPLGYALVYCTVAKVNAFFVQQSALAAGNQGNQGSLGNQHAPDQGAQGAPYGHIHGDAR